MWRFTLLFLLGLSLPSLAAVEKRTFCVYDPLGASGSLFGMMKDYRTEALT
ncbi:MAG: hypothetical protein RL217_959 [Pseudomonadota bacterium]|jgi:hypothetical protein